MSAVFIDPGYAKRGRGSAVAVFNGATHRLVGAAFARPAEFARFADGVGIVIIEKPQVDARTMQSVATVVELAWQGAALAYLIAGRAGVGVVELTPSRWKGSARKPQHHHALWEVLTDDERRILGGASTEAMIEAACAAGARDRWRKKGGDYYPDSWLTHNLLDACALGATYYGRLRI